MKNKIFTLMFASLFAFVFLVGMASAGLDFLDNSNSTITSVSDSTTQGSTASYSFRLQEDGYGNMTGISFTTPIILTSGSNSLNASLTVSNAPTELNNSQISDLVTITFNVPTTQTTGTYTSDFEVIGTYNKTSTNTLPLILTVTSSTTTPTGTFCAYDSGTEDNDGDLEVSIKDISVMEGFGDDEEWLVMDEIEVEVKVENNGDYDIDDISLEWGIGNDDMDEWMIEVDEEDEFNLKDGKDETFTFTFQIDDDMDIDLEDLSSSYNLFVRATGTIDDSDSPNDGDETCACDSEEISIESEDDFVILYDIQVQDSASCGESVQVTADVWNIGEDDQDDVTVKIYNKELEITEYKDYSEIEAFENENLNIFFEIPEDAKEKSYVFTAEVYDEDNDIYENEFDDEESRFTFVVDVLGGCSDSTPTTEIPSVVVSAAMESGGTAGDQLVIRTTLTNTGSDTDTFVVAASGYAGWASLVDISPTVMTINAGSSKDVLVTLDVDKSVSGSQLFNVDVTTGSGEVFSQPVQVSVQVAPAGFLSGITGNVISDNPLAKVLLGLIVLALVIIIVVLVVRVLRK